MIQAWKTYLALKRTSSCSSSAGIFLHLLGVLRHCTKGSPNFEFHETLEVYISFFRGGAAMATAGKGDDGNLFISGSTTAIIPMP